MATYARRRRFKPAVRLAHSRTAGMDSVVRTGGADDPLLVEASVLIMAGKSLEGHTQPHDALMFKPRGFIDQKITGRNQTLLYMAARRGNGRAVRALLALGASTDARNGDGSTPLHGAAYGFDEFVKSPDPAVRQADFLARLDAISALVAAGADRNILKNPGQNAGSVKADLRGLGPDK